MKIRHVLGCLVTLGLIRIGVTAYAQRPPAAPAKQPEISVSPAAVLAEVDKLKKDISDLKKQNAELDKKLTSISGDVAALKLLAAGANQSAAEVKKEMTEAGNKLADLDKRFSQHSHTYERWSLGWRNNQCVSGTKGSIISPVNIQCADIYQWTSENIKTSSPVP